ncbi:hypothetical protein U91I_01758 [alpha proteobacterium U9-1i]|nr:hypothetical protein U91I_01758 [alpha proteobacterium U9-1i]
MRPETESRDGQPNVCRFISVRVTCLQTHIDVMQTSRLTASVEDIK